MALKKLALTVVMALSMQASAQDAPTYYPVTFHLTHANGRSATYTPYRLVLNGDHDLKVLRYPSTVIVVPAQNDGLSVEGVTDRYGDSEVILLNRLPDQNSSYIVRQVGGNKPFGVVFKLVNLEGKPLHFMPYTIKICSKRRYQGMTDAKGYTYYYTSDTPCQAKLYLQE